MRVCEQWTITGFNVYLKSYFKSRLHFPSLMGSAEPAGRYYSAPALSHSNPSTRHILTIYIKGSVRIHIHVLELPMIQI